MAKRRYDDAFRPKWRLPAWLPAALILAAAFIAFAAVNRPWSAARPLPMTHAAPPAPSDELDEINYVLNVKSLKFHRPDCQSVEDMKPKNRQDYAGSRDELIAVGYAPCKRCNP